MKKLKYNFFVSVTFIFFTFNLYADEAVSRVSSQLEQNVDNKVIKDKKALSDLNEATEGNGQVSIPAAIESQANIKLEPAVFVHKVKGKLKKIYKRLFTGLENNGYYVIFEPNLGRNLAHFAKRWGKDYNKNKLDAIRSMVFCNGWYANKISNEDPNMLALCPLHVTLFQKEGFTTVLFVKPGVVSQGSPASGVSLELEQDVIRIIKESAR